MHRRCIKWGFSGFVFGVLVVIVSGLTTMPTDAMDRMAMMLGTLFAVGSAMVIAVAYTLTANEAARRPFDEGWLEGHEAGYSKGWRECARANMRPVSPIRDRRRDAG